MGTPVEFDRYYQPKNDLRMYRYEFTDLIPASDTIVSVSVYTNDDDIAEVVAQRTTDGQVIALAINTSGCTVGVEYLVSCRVTTSSGKVHTITKAITCTDEEATVAIGVTTPALGAIYSCLLSQTGTNAPTPTILVNQLSAAVVWTRVSEGIYRGTLTGAFTADKTRVIPKLIKAQVGDEWDADGYRVSADVVELRVMDLAGNVVDGFTNMALDIEVYT